MAGTLVKSLHDDFEPEAFEDGYRRRVLKLIEAKARGEEPDLPEPAEEPGGMDLAAALEASLSKSGNGAGKRKSGRTSRRAAKGKSKAKR
jgi:DNA end-binding protein Ku